MTTETDIQEIARRLGWNVDASSTVTTPPPPGTRALWGDIYRNSETNADLHMRWMDMLDNFTLLKEDGQYSFMGSGFWWIDVKEAIRAALLAKLRSEQE